MGNSNPNNSLAVARPAVIPWWAALAVCGFIFSHAAQGQTSSNAFCFDDYFLAPVRVHLLSAKDSPAIQTTLIESDITRILGKLNRVWAQAGLHCYLESLVSEEAVENPPAMPTQIDPARLLELRPARSTATNLFHIYFVKAMPMNGIYFPEAIFVKDTASLRPVPGGLDEPLPRVTSHELGHALGLGHRQDTTNLMASGTTGTWLNDEEIKHVRETVGHLDWVESAPMLIRTANTLFEAGKINEAARFYGGLVTLPLQDQRIDLAKQRLARANGSRRQDPNQPSSPLPGAAK